MNGSTTWIPALTAFTSTKGEISDKFLASSFGRITRSSYVVQDRVMENAIASVRVKYPKKILQQFFEYFVLVAFQVLE